MGKQEIQSTNGFRVIKTSNIIFSWIMVVFIAGGSWAWSNFKINENAEAIIECQKTEAELQQWKNAHEELQKEQISERTRQWFEIQINLQHICKKLNVPYEIISPDQINQIKKRKE